MAVAPIVKKPGKRGGQEVGRLARREGQSRRTTFQMYFLGKDGEERGGPVLPDLKDVLW